MSTKIQIAIEGMSMGRRLGALERLELGIAP